MGGGLGVGRSITGAPAKWCTSRANRAAGGGQAAGGVDLVGSLPSSWRSYAWNAPGVHSGGLDYPSRGSLRLCSTIRVSARTFWRRPGDGRRRLIPTPRGRRLANVQRGGRAASATLRLTSRMAEATPPAAGPMPRVPVLTRPAGTLFGISNRRRVSGPLPSSKRSGGVPQVSARADAVLHLPPSRTGSPPNVEEGRRLLAGGLSEEAE